MINENDRTIEITKENGEKMLCTVLFTYYSEQHHSNYIVYVIKGSTEARAAKYYETEDKAGRLEAITSDEEWDMINKLIDEYDEEQ